MLVLTHREGDVLEVGEHIRIHVKEVRGNQVRLAIEAPADVRLRRRQRGEAGDPKVEEGEEETAAHE